MEPKTKSRYILAELDDEGLWTFVLMQKGTRVGSPSHTPEVAQMEFPRGRTAENDQIPVLFANTGTWGTVGTLVRRMHRYVSMRTNDSGVVVYTVIYNASPEIQDTRNPAEVLRRFLRYNVRATPDDIFVWVGDKSAWGTYASCCQPREEVAS